MADDEIVNLARIASASNNYSGGRWISAEFSRADLLGFARAVLAAASYETRAALAAPAVVVSAEPVADSEDWWIDLAERHACKDWDSRKADGFLNAVKALVRDALTTLPATPVGPDAVDARLHGWKFTPDEEGMQVNSPSGDACYLWDLDSRHSEQMGPGVCLREVMRQLCQDIVFASPLASTKPSKGVA